jgi:hypothetical protein
MSLKPAELRNLTWKEVREHVSDDMQRVHRAWADHGPGTTREVAEKSGLSLLTLRPRTTDLYQVGLVECVDRRGGEGVYSYRSEEQAEASQSWKLDRSSHKQSGRAAPAENPVQFMSEEQKLRWAASIMGRHARQKRRTVQPALSTQLDLLPAA